MSKYSVAQFEYKKWHPLTDLSQQNPSSSEPKGDADKKRPINSVTVVKSSDSDVKDSFESFASNAKTLLYHLVLKPGQSVREIMKALDFSGSAFEKAKHELITRGLITESKAGKKKYLIPKKEAFDYFGIVCPYANIYFVEHSFYMHMLGLTLKKNPSCKKVSLEYKLTDSGNTADVVTTGVDGNLCAFEVTDSVTNITQNSLKYQGLDAFSKITFVCRNDDILKAVKSKVLNAGLPLALLSKLDFVLLSSLLKD